MRVGVAIFLTDQCIDPVTLARAVEARGLDSLFVPEHTHMPVDHAPHPSGRAAAGPRSPHPRSVRRAGRRGSRHRPDRTRHRRVPARPTDEQGTVDRPHAQLAASDAWPKPSTPPAVLLGAGLGPRTLDDLVATCDGWLPSAGESEVLAELDRIASLRDAIR